MITTEVNDKMQLELEREKELKGTDGRRVLKHGQRQRHKERVRTVLDGTQ